MITLGTGIGGAIWRTARSSAASTGWPVNSATCRSSLRGTAAPCGNRGCWEQYSSGNALVREAKELAAADSRSPTICWTG